MPHDPGPDDARPTVEHRRHGESPHSVRRFRLVVEEGPEVRAYASHDGAASIGSHPANQLCLDDSTVSRFHCEVRIVSEGALVRDLGSRNGTLIDGVKVREGYVKHGSRLALGKVVLRFELERESDTIPVADAEQFGSLVGRSLAMRTTFARLERVAASDVTVLLEGETGTGKGAAAESIHKASRRSAGPFVVVDASAVPATLLEAELFGHERGAFTSAVARRAGALEEADGGTLFIDEIGELPLELQPKLLSVLETRTVRPLGGQGRRTIDVRFVVATNRDLRREVNEKRFRPDLYFRVAVAKITLPPLRERVDDIPLLVESMLEKLGGSRPASLDPARMALLQHATWPGNVRELRNHVERFLVFGDLDDPPAEPPGGRRPFLEARRRIVTEFERGYLTALAEEFGTRTGQAAQAAGLDRVYLYRLLRRYGLR